MTSRTTVNAPIAKMKMVSPRRSLRHCSGTNLRPKMVTTVSTIVRASASGQLEDTDVHPVGRHVVIDPPEHERSGRHQADPG